MGNVYMEASQINYRGGSKKMSVEEAIKAAGTEITPEEKTWIDSIPMLTTDKADNDVIAPEFDSEAGVYAIGDLVMYEGKLYEFTTAHETAGEWDSTEVSEKAVSDEIDTLKSGLTGHVFGSFTPTASSTRGDIAVALNAIFTNLSDEDKRLCKIIRNDGYVFVGSGNRGNFVSIGVSGEYLNLQIYDINLTAGKYVGWSSLSTTEGEDMSDSLDVEGRTHYLIRG